MQQTQRSVGAPRLEDDYEEDDAMPLEGIVKSAVLQECRVFSAVTIRTSTCRHLIQQVLYLLYTGVTLSPTEATDIFFGATKLFQSDSPKLRRMLYILLKELSPIAEQVFIASSSLMKDISGNVDANRCNGIRTLRKVLDVDMINAVERHLQQALVDQSNSVVSAAIVTGIHLSHTQPDTVKRWSTQLVDALKNRGNKVQYHALALLHKIRRNDRLAVQKLIQQHQNSPQMLAPLALCVLVRMSAELIQEDFQQSEDLYRFVVNMTHHTSDMVVFEAAKAIVGLRNVTGREVAPAVVVIGFFLTAHKSVLRFAAIRLMSQVATFHPSAASSISTADVEGLLTDPNKSISALATTTLLKTGNQWSVVRLIKQLTAPSFFELTDDYKTIIVEAMQVLVVKFPERHQDFIDFLFFTLRDGGAVAAQSAVFKTKVLETAMAIMQVLPSCKEYVLITIAEYLEDCPVVEMVERGMCLLGDEVVTCQEPKKFVRLIYNHVMLESPVIRAAAVTTLAKVAAAVTDLRRGIAVLLRRTLADPDDEVRDRAMLYWKLLTTGDEVAIQTLIVQVSQHVAREQAILQPAKAAPDALLAETATSVPFDERPGDGAGPSTVIMQLTDRMHRVSQLRDLGLPLHSVEPAMLTDADNEFVVAVAKHAFPSHTVLQYKVTNTMEGSTLHQVTISTDVSELEAEPQFATSIASLGPSATDYCYVVLMHAPPSFPAGTVRCSCAFALSEGDAAPPGDVEDYPLDEFALNVSDYIEPFELSTSAFEAQWTSMREAETTSTYALKAMRNVTVAAHEICDFFGMGIVGGKPEKISSKSHTLNMCGRVAYQQRATVLISAKVFVSTDNAVALTLSIRGGDALLRDYLSAALMG